jgi:hypothetical protein
MLCRWYCCLWDVDDLDEMTLEPCVWATNWKVNNGVLDLHVKQRSADMAVLLKHRYDDRKRERHRYTSASYQTQSRAGRQLMTSLWDVDDLDEMTLEPCVWATNWKVNNGVLDLHDMTIVNVSVIDTPVHRTKLKAELVGN